MTVRNDGIDPGTEKAEGGRSPVQAVLNNLCSKVLRKTAQILKDKI